MDEFLFTICLMNMFRYAQEYGFPSTHAMFAAGIPISLVLLSHQRYDVRFIDISPLIKISRFHLV